MQPPAVRIAELGRHAGQMVTLRGWVTHLRSSGKVAFVVVRDGSGVVQAVVAKNAVPPDTWEAFGTLTLETSVAVTGEVRADARAPGGHELSVRGLAVVGASPLDYPVQPKEHGVDFLLDHRHLWLRSPRQAAILRVRHEVEQAIHDFFYERDFVRCDTPILTAAIGERSGLFSTEYFDEGTAYLAQTGQLYGEALAAALGRIYTFGPTFRAEKSKTRRHLTEFWMIEPEMAWYDQDDNMDLQEAFVRYLVGRVLERRGEELEVLERDPARLACVAEPFVRLDYGDAVALVQQKGSETHWGEDLGAPDEKLIVDHYERPVFVVNYPKEAKAFYMKENPADPRTVRCADLLAPEGRGEIIGGSQREERLEVLDARMDEMGLPKESYWWYRDLRRYGTVPHAGFGLGFERAIMYASGMANIRDVIPYPRTPGSAEF